MKCTPAISAIAAICLVACDTMSGPITSGGYDPLLPAGSGNSSTDRSIGVVFSAGQFVRASMDNTAFFKTRPSGSADADKLLRRGTSMKVISINSSYVKVELDSGEIGFVPSVMLEDPNAAPQAVTTTAPGEYQVYPPLPGTGIGQPLPPLDPAGLPPEGAIPTVIDPDAPASPPPVPPVSSNADSIATPVAPVEPKVESELAPAKTPEDAVPGQESTPKAEQE